MQHSRSDIFNEAKAKFAEYLKEVQEIEERELSDKETGKISTSYPDANRIKNKSGNYEIMLAKAKVDTHKSVNNIIEHLADPLYKEYNSKNVYRKRMLIGFSIFFAVITAATFVLVFLFSAEGYTCLLYTSDAADEL